MRMATGLEALKGLGFVLDTPPATAIVREVGDSNIVLRFFGWVDQAHTDFLKGRSLAPSGDEGRAGGCRVSRCPNRSTG